MTVDCGVEKEPGLIHRVIPSELMPVLERKVVEGARTQHRLFAIRVRGSLVEALAGEKSQVFPESLSPAVVVQIRQ